MKKLQVATAALAAMAVAVPCSARAEAEIDKKSYWTGFYLGTVLTVCELQKQGIVSENDAKVWLAEVGKGSEYAPEVSWKSALSQAAEMEEYKKCPLPR